MKNNPRRISSKTMPTRGITRIKAALTKVLQPALISTSARSYVEGNSERIFASLFFAGVFAPISAAFDHFGNLPARFVAERHQQERRYPFQKPIGEIQNMVLFGDGSEQNGNQDHEPVQSIQTSESCKSQQVRVLPLLVCVRIKHWFVPPASPSLLASSFSASPRAITRPLVRDRCSCPRPSVAPSNRPPRVRLGCTPFAGPAPAERCTGQQSGPSSPACSSSGESL